MQSKDTSHANNSQAKNNEPSFKKYPTKKDFTVIPNRLICDSSISMAARLLLIFLLQLPEFVMNTNGEMTRWIIYHSHLKKSMNIGNTALTNYINELIEAGYMRRKERVRYDDGRYAPYEYEYSDFKVFLPNRVTRTRLPESANQNVCNTNRENTNLRETAAAKDPIVQSCPPSSSASPPAAASFETKAKTAVEKTSEPPKTEVYDCLKDLDIPDRDKQWLTNRFNLPKVERSVAWATHPTTQLKKTLSAALKWFLAFPDKDEPKTPDDMSNSKEKTESKNRSLARLIEKEVYHPSGYEFHALSKYASIEGSAYQETQSFQYSDHKFQDKIYMALEKMGFKKKRIKK